MSAIYQRARPVRWEDVVGQEHVKNVLKAALEQGRVGHAYLFSGPRGVGKTTTARLIAMTANCQSDGLKPCGECESCLSVRAGSHPDVLEIDAASNNSVDDVRELREKVSLAAMRGGKKIYILDEAHMMSKSAFNALLKTLEEPPEHVIFILATTEPEKIIPTILSRCQHYRFRRLTAEEIAGKLAGLAQAEEASAEEEALHLIGRLADGAMRDGESLLERMLAAGKSITRQGVEEALGLPPSERVRGIAAALISGDAGAALAEAGKLYRDGFAARTVVEGLVDAFGHALHAELGLGGEKLEGAKVPRLLRLQAELDAQEARFARSADQQSLELALTHALLAAENGSQPTPTSAQQAQRQPTGAPQPELMQRLNRLEKELATLKASGMRPATVPTTSPPAQPVGRSNQPTPVRQAVQQAVESVGGRNKQEAWDIFLKAISKIGGPTVRAYIKEARYELEDHGIRFIFNKIDKKGKPANKFHGDGVLRHIDIVQKAVEQVFGNINIIIDIFGEERRFSTQKSKTSTHISHPITDVNTEEISRNDPLDSHQPTSHIPQQLTQTVSTLSNQSQLPDFDPMARQGRKSASAVAVTEAPPKTEQQTQTSVAPPPPLTTQRPTTTTKENVVEEDMPFNDSGEQEFELADNVKHVNTASLNAEVPPPPPRPPEQTPAPPAERELYLGEVITEEPNWDDFGGPSTETKEQSVKDSLEDAPYAEFSAKRPDTNAHTEPHPQPTDQPESTEEPPAQTAKKNLGDIRAHPMYEEVKHRFQGRVREIGKNRKPIAETNQNTENTEQESED